jgi:hypothetical protein
MVRSRFAAAAALTLLAATGWAFAGPVTGHNLLDNGEFEEDGVYPPVQLPTDWDTFVSTDPENWDGVKLYGSEAGHPYPRPDGHGMPLDGNKCYGDVAEDGSTATGKISQVLGTGTPGEMWVGGWVYSADNVLQNPYVKFALDQPATGKSWDSGELFYITGGTATWSWHEFTIPADYGFGFGEVIFSVEIKLGQGVGIGIHGMMADGLEVESAGLTAGACCLPDGTCIGVQSEDACLNHDPPGTWGGFGTSCELDVNGNGKPDLCEACVQHDPFADADGDNDVDQEDFGIFQACFTDTDDPGGAFDPVLCSCLDQDDDDDVDQQDLLAFELCASGPEVNAVPSCDGP